MIRAPKICVICGDSFTPQKASEVRDRQACGYACAGALRKKKYRGTARSATPQARAHLLICLCSTCKAKRGGKDAELIAKVAAEMGVPVSTSPPPPKMNPVGWARRAAIVRRRMEAERGYVG